MTLAALFFLAPVLLLPLGLALAGVVPAWQRGVFHLLPLAPLPGLIAALFAPAGLTLDAPDMLLGLRLEMTPHGAVFLGFASLLWTAAAVFAQGYMRDTACMSGFCSFWCLTLAGNLGVFIAGDVATFYLTFACVSLAAYPLIVHERTDRAMKAGFVYILLAVLGETLLLLGFMLIAAEAESLFVADIPQVLATLERRDAAILLLVGGFGLKAGLVPLHVWLPLAHPAAPTPASAVLSGAIVKAGIFGLIQFLPAGMDSGAWSDGLIWAGLLTCWFGIAVGLTQSNPKTILAYSTVSQMGIVIAVIGAALSASEPALALGAATLYALHHGLAKGTLFMGVGVAQKANDTVVKPVFAFLALVAVSVAGLPLTGGAIAKLAIKNPLGEGVAELLVILSAVGTSLLLLRFLIKLHAGRKAAASAPPSWTMTIPFVVTGLAALLAPWLIYPALTDLSVSYILGFANLWTASWPILIAAIMAAIVLYADPWRAPDVPEGDLVEPARAGIARLTEMGRSVYARYARPLPAPRKRLLNLTGAILPLIESRLASWRVAGIALLVLVICLTMANTLFVS